jgi:TPR repeat protein
MKRSILIPVLSLLTSILLCTDVLAETKAPTHYQAGQPRSGAADRFINSSFVTTPNAVEVKRDLRAAEQGDASAQFKMGLRYDLGVGVPQNYIESVKWLRKAAEQGDANAQYNLGSMYYSGLGVSQDLVEAFQWFGKAAEQGDTSAQKNLGAMYGTGQGVPQNHTEAYVWSSIATMSGNKEAINNLDYAASNLSPEDLGLAQNRATKLYGEIQ